MSHDVESAGGRAAFGHTAQTEPQSPATDAGSMCSAVLAEPVSTPSLALPPNVVRLPGCAPSRVVQRPGPRRQASNVQSLEPGATCFGESTKARRDSLRRSCAEVERLIAEHLQTADAYRDVLDGLKRRLRAVGKGGAA